MIDLDDLSSYPAIDTQDMRAHVDGLPEQLWSAWELGQRLPLPPRQGIDRAVLAGMGGSAIGADLLAAYAARHCPIPIGVHRNYGLPAWAHGANTLVIATSHSGNTQETLSAFELAAARGCRILTISTGGRLAELAQGAGATAWQFTHRGQPRSAVGFSFGLLLAAFTRLGFLPNPSAELGEAIEAMRSQQQSLRAEVPVVRNPAKRMAGQLLGRWVAVVGADLLEPVARRWKGQINEVAKAWAQLEALPEADHNTIAGSLNPEEALAHTLVLFLRAPSYHPANLLRTNLTKQALMLEGLNTDFIDAQGQGPLAHVWTALHFGDYTAFYLALAYGVDPTPIAAIERFKGEMERAGG